MSAALAIDFDYLPPSAANDNVKAVCQGHEFRSCELKIGVKGPGRGEAHLARLRRTYDGVNNRIRQQNFNGGPRSPAEFSFNANNQLVSTFRRPIADPNVSRQTYETRYDHRGNTTSYQTRDIGTVILKSDMANQIRKTIADGVERYHYYDGHKRRVKVVDSTGGIKKYYFYDVTGQLLAMSKVDIHGKTSATNYVVADGKTIARVVTSSDRPNQGGRRYYIHSDHLGTQSMATDIFGDVAFDENLLPLGHVRSGGQSRLNEDQASFTGHVRDKYSGLTYMQARFYAGGRFLSVDPVTFTGSGGNPGYFNRYVYVMNDPVNHNDPTGMFCNALNKGSQFCARSQRFANLAANPVISSRTTFLSAASVITEELGALDHFSARFVTSPDVRRNLRATSKLLEQSNTIMANAIASGKGFSGGTVAQNDAAFVRYEQGIVQGLLDGLQVTDPNTYANVVRQSNSTLNSSLGHSKQFNKVLDSVRSDLGRDINFANKSDRIAIGDALTSAIRNDQKVTCTGSRIKRSAC